MIRKEFVIVGNDLADLSRLQSMAGRPQPNEANMTATTTTKAEDQTPTELCRKVIRELGMRASESEIAAALKKKHGLTMTEKAVYQVKYRLRRGRKMSRQAGIILTGGGRRRKLSITDQESDLLAAKEFLAACGGRLQRAEQALVLYARLFNQP